MSDNYDADDDEQPAEVNLSSFVSDEVEADNDIDEPNDEVLVTVAKKINCSLLN